MFETVPVVFDALTDVTGNSAIISIWAIPVPLLPPPPPALFVDSFHIVSVSPPSIIIIRLSISGVAPMREFVAIKVPSVILGA